MSRWIPYLLIPSLALSAGCDMTRFLADNMVGQLENNKEAFFSEPCVRQAREAAPALLSFFDGFLVSSPENVELLLLGAALNVGTATALIQDEDEEYARALFAKAEDYAGRALSLDYPELYEALRGRDDGPLLAALAELNADQVPYVFWFVASIAGRTNLTRDEPDLVAQLSRWVQVMERVVKVDPEFYDGGPHVFLGQYFASKSKMLGGDPEKAEEHFQAAEKIAGDRMLLIPVFYAEGLTNQEMSMEVREKYEAALKRVLASGEGPRNRRLVTALAKKKAQAMLDEIDDVFPLDLL